MDYGNDVFKGRFVGNCFCDQFIFEDLKHHQTVNKGVECYSFIIAIFIKIFGSGTVDIKTNYGSVYLDRRSVREILLKKVGEQQQATKIQKLATILRASNDTLKTEFEALLRNPNPQQPPMQNNGAIFLCNQNFNSTPMILRPVQENQILNQYPPVSMQVAPPQVSIEKYNGDQVLLEKRNIVNSMKNEVSGILDEVSKTLEEIIQFLSSNYTQEQFLSKAPEFQKSLAQLECYNAKIKEHVLAAFNSLHLNEAELQKLRQCGTYGVTLNIQINKLILFVNDFSTSILDKRLRLNEQYSRVKETIKYTLAAANKTKENSIEIIKKMKKEMCANSFYIERALIEKFCAVFHY